MNPPDGTRDIAVTPSAHGLSARIVPRDLGLAPQRVWNPSPSAQHRTESCDLPMRIDIGVRGTPECGAKYSPPPFAVVVEGDACAALVAVSADAGWHRWNHVILEVDADGVFASIDLEGATEPAEAAAHVRLHVIPAETGEARHALLARGMARLYPEAAVNPPPPADWWTQPIYCGWGDQVTTSMWLEGVGPERRALAYCLQGLYERWIARLDEADVPFGTIIIDAGWSPAGMWEPTPTMWPDLRGFIDVQHAKGRRVLLWLATWMYDGLPDEWCIHVGDRPITSDPTHPDYLAHARRQVQRLIGPDGFDADGFKMDQLAYCPTAGPGRFAPRFGWPTHNEPDGPPLRTHGDGFGCELLHTLQKTIHDAAKEAKPDALITSSTVHPYYRDTLDMVRIHDMGHVAPDIFDAMRARVDLARAALPGKLIDTDDWIHTDYDMWMRYTCGSHALGVPCIFYAERFQKDWHNEPATVSIPMADLRTIAAAWRDAGFRAGE